MGALSRRCRFEERKCIENASIEVVDTRKVQLLQRAVLASDN